MATIRSLAKQLGLSRTTVSDALRGSPRVGAETAQRVRAAADAAGYKTNPLAGAVMSALRRAPGGVFRGVLAVIDVHEPARPDYALRYHAALLEGARRGAAHQGCGVERFVVGVRGLTVARLDGILKARGIRGIMLLPCWEDPEFGQLDWPHYAGIYADYIIHHPPLHAVCPDHYRSMIETLERLVTLGYRRPGLFLPLQHDQRLQHRWEAAFSIFQHHHLAAPRVPPLVSPTRALDEGAFRAWFREHQPDVVLGHRTEVMEWMRAEGARIPETHGFVCLNLVVAAAPAAGLDQQPELLGQRGAEMIVAMLHRNEYGIPDTPSITAVAARWVDGATLRPRGV